MTEPASVPRQHVLFGYPQTEKTADDYYTPKHVFDALGLRFELDVAAPPGGVPWVPAARYYTKEDDGLAQPWTGRVWMNPPYSEATVWVRRFIEHRHGVALLGHAKSAWHPTLWAAADAVAFPFRYFDFVGGSIMLPVWFAAFGDECVDALQRVGVVRYRADYQPALVLPEAESGADEVAVIDAHIDGYRRLDPDAPAPPLEGGDWGLAEDLDDGGMSEPSDPGDGAE